MDAVHFVTIESVWIKKGSGVKIREFLSRESDFLFRHEPEKTLQIWALLIHASRTIDEEKYTKKNKLFPLFSWSETSLDFFGLYTDFYNKEQGIDDLFSLETNYSAIIALANCAPATFRPVDQLFKCLQSLFEANDEV